LIKYLTKLANLIQEVSLISDLAKFKYIELKHIYSELYLLEELIFDKKIFFCVVKYRRRCNPLCYKLSIK